LACGLRPTAKVSRREKHFLVKATLARGKIEGSLQDITEKSKATEDLSFLTDRLIAAGENSGRMGMIDRWVLSTTLAWLNSNYTQLKHTNFVCMNLSGASLNDEKFLQDVYAMLEQNLHLVAQLCLEITESVALHDLENTRRFIDKVRGYGAKVALDDFGAGYTWFSYFQDETLAQYVDLIEKSNQLLPQVDLFSEVRVVNLH